MKNVRSISFLLKYIIRNQRSYYPIGFLLILLNIANTWISVISVRLLLDALSRADYHATLLVAIFLPLVMAVLGILRNSVQRTLNTKGKKISLSLKAELAKKQMLFPQDLLESQDIREQYHFAKKCTEDDIISSLLTDCNSLVSNAANIIGSIALFASVNFYVMLFLLLLAIASTIGNVIRMKYKYEQREDESPIEMNMYYARDYLTGPVFAKEVRAFDLRNFISAKVKNYIEKFFLLECNTSARYFRKFWWTYIIGFIQLAVTYFYIGFLLEQKAITISEFSTYISAILVFSGAVSELFLSVSNSVQNSRYVHHLKSFLNYDSANVSDPYAPIPHNTDYEIVFSNVSFRYQEDRPWILKDINLVIKPHEKICIVGVNGAGKTTLVNLLMGFYKPTTGSILLNGRNIAEFKHEDYLRLFATVFQDFNIFAFSIEENIRMGMPLHDADIIDAIRKAGLTEVVSNLKEGEETYISQRIGTSGTDLSGGEKQLLAIARAIYKKAPICILDEPTAALSPQNEYAIYQKFDEITQGQTVIYISHRLNSCKLADRILVLSDNRIAESGGHAELMEKQGLYHQMFTSQSQYYHTAETSEEGVDDGQST